MIAADSVAVVARFRALHERRRLGELALEAIDTPGDAEFNTERERLDDCLRPEIVAPAVRAAELASPGRAGERERQAARVMIAPYLDRACGEQDAAIAERYRRERDSQTDFATAIALENDPTVRDRLDRQWRTLERSLEGVRTARQEARNGAARTLGFHSAFHLAACAEPRDPVALADDVERDAVRPLDDASGRAARSASTIAGLPAFTGSARLRWLHLVDFDACLDRAAIAPILRQLGSALGEDPDTNGPRLIRGRAAWDAALLPPGERAAVVTGVAGGLGGLRAALLAFGRAARSGAVGRQRGPSAAAGADSAFDTAAAILFARLLRSAPFRSWAGVREAPSLAPAVAFVEAVQVRSSWSRLRTAARGFQSGDPVDLPDFSAPEYETAGASELRGAIFAILLEERLMTRHGRSWFIDREAGRRLAEMWEAEPDETAESMAGALSLGKMTADVFLEGFRP